MIISQLLATGSKNGSYCSYDGIMNEYSVFHIKKIWALAISFFQKWFKTNSILINVVHEPVESEPTKGNTSMGKV